jgi:hypothetical protein
VASAALGLALLLGLAGDTLLRDGPVGIGFPVWVGLVAMTLVSMAWRADLSVPREATAWLAVAVVFATGLAWRDSEMLQFFDFVAAMGALSMGVARINHAGSVLFASRLRDTIGALVTVALSALAGMVPLVVQRFWSEESRLQPKRNLRTVGRIAMIAVPLLLVFGSLLRSADPIFASLVTLPDIDVEMVVSHLFVIGACAWFAAGWTRGALVAKDGSAIGAKVSLPQLDTLEITTALVTLNALFGAFVATQLGWFFGGEEFLRARTGLTAASYARQGFFQMLLVVALVVPLLVATRAMLRPGRALARRHTMLSLPVTALLGAIVVSALFRMKLYVGYYGLSIDRFYPLVFMAWLGVVLVWLALTVLRGWGRPFIGGVVITGLTTLAALNVAAPDRIVARFNIGRAPHDTSEAAREIDLAYLSQLGGEAAGLVTNAVLADRREASGPADTTIDAQRCAAATRLLRRWGPISSARERRITNPAWRSWNAGEAAAVRVVGARGMELRALAHASCARSRSATPQR